MIRIMDYHLTPLGKPFVFFVPVEKLVISNSSGLTIETKLEKFLTDTYGGFTSEGSVHFGVWREGGKNYFDQNRKYRVAIAEAAGQATLIDFLADIAKEMNEEAIYLESGDQSWLLEVGDSKV